MNIGIAIIVGLGFLYVSIGLCTLNSILDVLRDIRDAIKDNSKGSV